MCLTGVGGVASGSKGIRIICESVEKLLRCDGDLEKNMQLLR